MANKALDTKFVMAIPPQAVDDDGFAGAVVDTLGYHYAQVVVQVGDIPADMVVLQVLESDSDNNDGTVDEFEEIDGLDFSASTEHGTPGSGDDEQLFAFEFDLRGRKRYFYVNAVAGNGATATYLAALVILSRPGLSPQNDEARGLAASLKIP